MGSLFGEFLPPEKGVRNGILRRQLYEPLCEFFSAERNFQFEALRSPKYLVCPNRNKREEKMCAVLPSTEESAIVRGSTRRGSLLTRATIGYLLERASLTDTIDSAAKSHAATTQYG